MRARGFSLVEFMIAITIGLFLVAGLVYLIAETSRSRAEMERSSRQIENGRYALERLSEDLRHAGFFSEFFCLMSGIGGVSCQAVTIPPFPADTAAAQPCTTTAANLQNGMALAIQGYAGGASAPAELDGCIAELGVQRIKEDYEPNTDVLVIRRAATTVAAKTNLGVDALPDDNQPYIQTTAREYKIDTGTNRAQFKIPLPAFPGLKRPTNNSAVDDVAWVRRYMVRIYFVSKCNAFAAGQNKCTAAADNGLPVPTLKMLELGNGAFTTVTLAEGIEQLQFDYGIDSAGNDGIADGALSACNPCDPDAALNVAAWSNVVSVQVNLIARNTEQSPNYTDDKTYNLGTFGVYTPPAGVRQYRRHAYTAMVRLNNVAMRREE
jgi:type IV pilus assembly protein PilW